MGKVVLFVDSSTAQLNEYQRRFETQWRSEYTRSPWMALYFIAKNKVDLVVTEVDFPDLHFDEFLRRAREHQPSLPFLVVSSRHHPCSEPQTRKPVDYTELQQMIESALAHQAH